MRSKLWRTCRFPVLAVEAAFTSGWLEDQLNASKLPAGSDQFNSLRKKADRLSASCEQALAFGCCWPAAAILLRSVPCSIRRTAPLKRAGDGILRKIWPGRKASSRFADQVIVVWSSLSVKFMLQDVSKLERRSSGWSRRGKAYPTRRCNDAVEMFPNHLICCSLQQDYFPEIEKYVKPIPGR